MALSFDPAVLQGLSVHRLLRRDSIDQIVKILKITFGILSVTALALMLAAFFKHSLGAYSASASLAEKVEIALKKNSVNPTLAVDEGNNSLIVERDLFGPLGVQATPAATPVPIDKPKANVNLTLIGTFLGNADDSQAIIEDSKSKEQDVFLKGDSIFGSATLVAIYNNKVEIKRDGQIEVLLIDDSPDAISAADSGADAQESFSVDEAELNQALDNLPLLLTQARAVPYFKDGKAIGLRLFAIKNGSLYEKVGLKNGDILMSINDSSLGDISQAMKLFEKLKEERNISLTLERNKQKMVFSYSIN